MKVSPQCGPGCVEYTSSPQRTSWDIGDTGKAGQCASERGPPAASDWKISWDKIRTKQNQVMSLGYFLLTLFTTKGVLEAFWTERVRPSLVNGLHIGLQHVGKN